jgi:nitroreductase/NAD-dependent dihydropyrimidine dehydrogenase PreA subunit
MIQIAVDRQACNGCGACSFVCIAHVYKLSEENVAQATPNNCWKCGHCVAACPVGAINHSEYPLALCPPIDSDILPNYQGLVGLFQERRSIRAFREKPIPRETLGELLEVGRYAPTGSNSQNIDWLVVDDAQTIQALSKRTVQFLAKMARFLRNPLVQLFFRVSRGREYVVVVKGFAPKLTILKTREDAGEEPIFYRAPAVAIALAPKSDGSARDNAIHALYNVELAARRIGLATCQMGFMKFALDRDQSLRDSLGVPRGSSPQAVLAIGYPKVTYNRTLPRRRPQITWLN